MITSSSHLILGRVGGKEIVKKEDLPPAAAFWFSSDMVKQKDYKEFVFHPSFWISPPPPPLTPLFLQSAAAASAAAAATTVIFSALQGFI